MSKVNGVNVEQHKRDESVSSVSTCSSGGMDHNDGLSLSDEDSCDGFSSADSFKRPRDLRPRLGAEMAVLASTSPEIKALNLPITPCFPGASTIQGCKESIQTAFSFPSFSDAQTPLPVAEKSHRSLSPLLKTMNDVEGSPDVSKGNDKTKLKMYLNPPDEPLGGLCGGGVFGITPKVNNLSSLAHIKQIENNFEHHTKHFFDDKENLHPNIVNSQPHQSKKLFDNRFRSISERHVIASNPFYRQPMSAEDFDSDFLKSIPRTIPILKQSLHRRGSCDALPSPYLLARIQQPSRHTIVQGSRAKLRKSSSGDVLYLPRENGIAEERHRQRIDHQRIHGMRKANSNIILTTGFR